MVGTQTSNVGNSGSGSDWSIYSEFARLNYNYDEKYLFEANLRNDASSKFARVIVQLFSPRSLWDGEFQKKDF